MALWVDQDKALYGVRLGKASDVVMRSIAASRLIGTARLTERLGDVSVDVTSRCAMGQSDDVTGSINGSSRVTLWVPSVGYLVVEYKFQLYQG